MEEEIWKDYWEYPNYSISSEGRIRNKKTGRILQGSTTAYGYLAVNLRDRLKHWKAITIHKLVALTFLYRELGQNVVNHKDGNKTNNRVENLEWCTYSQNSKHVYADDGLRRVPTWRKSVRCIETGEIFFFAKGGRAKLFPQGVCGSNI